MPWGRVGDDAFGYPRLLAVAGLPGAPASAVNEVFGFFMACALQSAAHTTDYVVNTGAVQTAGRGRWKRLLEWSVRVGLLTPIDTDDGLPHWVLINDPKFVHIRTAAELEAEDRKRDAAKKPHLVRDVRRRDGDSCRYCQILVVWDGRKSARSGELDHRNPSEYATHPDHLVVACRSCNGARQDNQHGWDDTHPLLPAPVDPFYGESTAAYLTKNGIPTQPNVEPGAIKARSSATQQQQPTRAAARDAAARPTPQPAPPTTGPEWAVGTTSEVAAELPPNADTGSIGTTSTGSGRDGTGPGPAKGPGPGTHRRRRRGRRGGQTQPRTDDQQQHPKPHAQPHDQEPAVPTPDCCPVPYRVADGSHLLCLTCGTEAQS